MPDEGFGDVTALVGRTPLVRLRRVVRGAPAAVLVKVEAANPAGSSKDRAALSMVRAAEASGALAPGGVIFEGSSGNTGIALAMIGAALGYRVVVVVPDRSSQEKLALLRAYGAEVVVTPALLPAEHPDQVRALAARLAAETPGGWYAGQYDNPANVDAHYSTTGPEIWAQTEGRVTHLVAGIGTGGTLTGAGRYLREVSGDRVQVVGADPESSVFGGGSGRPHLVEATGRFVHPQTRADVWPRSFDPAVTTGMRRVPDRAAIMTTRALAREEGLLVGASGGLAVAAAVALAHTLGPDDVVVAVAPDSGRSYLSKYFDDEWVSQRGFGPDGGPAPAVAPASETIAHTTTVEQARVALGQGHALPVVLRQADQGEPVAVAQIIGSVSLDGLRAAAPEELVADHLGPALPLAGAHEPVSAVRERLAQAHDAVVVTHDGLVVAVLPVSELDSRAEVIGDLVP